MGGARRGLNVWGVEQEGEGKRDQGGIKEKEGGRGRRKGRGEGVRV